MYEVTARSGSGFCFGSLEGKRPSPLALKAFSMPSPKVIITLRKLNALIILASAALYISNFDISGRVLLTLLWAQVAQLLLKVLVLWKPIRLEVDASSVVGPLNNGFVYEQMLYLSSFSIIWAWCGVRGIIPGMLFVPILVAIACLLLRVSRLKSR